MTRRRWTYEEEFFATISHELRAPIAAMLLWERTLRDPTLDEAERTRALDAIHDCAVTQSRLVDDLIDIARVTTGKLSIRKEHIPLQRCVERALDAVRPSIQTRQQTLATTIAADLGYVDGDATRLAQILENLLSNASKFTPERGRIALSAYREKTDVVVEVTDSGRGITAEFMPHIFEIFSQEDAALARTATGMGVGLAIAFELAALHDGSLIAESLGRDQGAKFSLRLPSVAVPSPTGIALVSDPVLDGISLLLVDDDERVLGALELLLGRAGASVRCAESVVAAMTALEQWTPDVVVSDLAMPDLDGFALAQRMREIPRLADIPRIALSARAATVDPSLDREFHVHLRKPVDLDTLVASIVLLVRQRSTTIE